MKKWFRIFLIVLFPLGMLFCIGKNLFTKSWASFLGGISLFVVGFVLALFLFNPEIMQKVFPFFY